MAMHKNQFDALLATLKSKTESSRDTVFIAETNRALEEALAHNTTGLTASELAEVRADFEAVKSGQYKDAIPVPVPVIHDPQNKVVNTSPGSVLGGPSARKPEPVPFRKPGRLGQVDEDFDR